MIGIAIAVHITVLLILYVQVDPLFIQAVAFVEALYGQLKVNAQIQEHKEAKARRHMSHSRLT